ncbi:MAG: phosphoesterase [Desulfobacterales bacterium]|nr:MAG: phosphoesterase [Desulfobacterales bacterium]
MKRSAVERLRQFLACFQAKDQVLILINADPDAISSAMAVRRLLWRKTAGIVIASVNTVKRPDNLAMIRLLRVNLRHARDIDRADFDRVVLVDSQPDHGDAFAPFARIDAVIDHHPRGNLPNLAFCDIRPEYGATATMMTEYLRAARIKPASRLATALFLGIKTDTGNFERQAILDDMRAFQFLFRYANTDLARKIEESDLTPDFLPLFRIGIERMQLRRRRAFAHLGRVENPDVCVLLAEFFMRVNPVSWSFVSGLYEDRLVLIVRNDGIRKNAGALVKERFDAYGSGGGHKSVARAELTAAALASELDVTNDAAVLQWIITRVEQP